MLIVYSFLLFLGFLLLTPYFLFQALRHGKYLVSLMERTGRLPDALRQSSRGAIWIHAVSVGESNAIAPLVSRLKQQVGARKIFVSTTTLTGQQNARDRIAVADGFFYYPFDWRGNVRRSFDHIQPALVCLTETELWPNFIDEAHRRGIKLVVVNGRISEGSFRWYSRITGFLRRVLPEVDLFLMQTEEDAGRIRTLGAPADSVRVYGNLKYDVELDLSPTAGQELIRQKFLNRSGAALWVAGSTAEGEEDPILEAFRMVKAQIPEARLILAPRRPERFDSVASLLASRNFRFIRRTQLDTSEVRDADVLLLDTVGELSGLYGLARLAFVGGSLVEKGGHNILEPAAVGVPVLFGPHMSNFEKVSRDFLDQAAALRIRDARDLAATVLDLMRHSEKAKAIGERGRKMITKNSGATARTVDTILELL